VFTIARDYRMRLSKPDGRHFEGMWYNELGSCMNIEFAKDGMLTQM